MINVTRSFLPPKEEYEKYISRIWENHYLTNQGPLVQELEQKLKEYLQAENFQFVSNGTIALQLALNALDITEGEIITTPFSFAATTTSIIWERCKPIFVDIETERFGIDVSKIEEAITDKTKAIMAVHVYGYPCDVEKIEEIANRHNLKVIYDAAHCFGAKYKNKSLLSYGDVSTCSFHATKVYHTVEGGCCVAKDKVVSDKLESLRSFGFQGENYICAGINAKNSEFHAAMGLSNYKYIDTIIEERKTLSELYDSLLEGVVQRPVSPENFDYNYAYYPVVFKNEEELLNVFDELNREEIYPRRYFYPSLNNLPYIDDHKSCPNSEDISKRVACLPLYNGLKTKEVAHICEILKKSLIK
ncbi:MAG: DegT/DnrJ/EryC1/StrS family aminotransferase [Bacilli bacterium]|nr:DegT/DnrJ/EryC1/StrS family aminotransferase [Bacilli bacterium]